MEQTKTVEGTGCCQPFDPAPWQEKEIVLRDKLFIQDRVRSILHIPLNFGQVMVRNMERIEKSGALADKPLMLSDENSLWGADIYIAVSKEVPGAKMAKISGTFLTKVFDGSYKDIGRWLKQMRDFVSGRGKAIKKLYFFYTTCPACAKYYGKNYTVILAEV